MWSPIKSKKRDVCTVQLGREGQTCRETLLKSDETKKGFKKRNRGMYTRGENIALVSKEREKQRIKEICCGRLDGLWQEYDMVNSTERELIKIIHKPFL